MKQIRVSSEFLDMTCSNCRRKVGEVLVVSDERAAYLVNGNLCEYVEDEKPETPAPTTDVEEVKKVGRKKASAKGAEK